MHQQLVILFNLVKFCFNGNHLDNFLRLEAAHAVVNQASCLAVESVLTAAVAKSAEAFKHEGLFDRVHGKGRTTWDILNEEVHVCAQ